MKKILLFIILFCTFSSNSQTVISACDLNSDGVEMVDLTTADAYFISLTGVPAGSAVTYFSSEADAQNNINPIPNPTAYVSGTAYLWVTVEGSTSVFQLLVTVDTPPVVDEMPDVTVCDAFTLPFLLVGNYFTQPGGGGTQIPYSEVLTVTQTVYIYASSPSGACDSESSFLVTIVNTPAVTPMTPITACNSYFLPSLLVGEYYTGPGGTGTQVAQSSEVFTSTLLYVYASNGFCSSETTFDLTINQTPNPQLQDGSICMEWGTNQLLSGYLLDTGLDSALYTFQWYMNGVAIAGSTSSSLIATQEGQYVVQVNGIPANGCTGMATAQVGISGPPVLNNVIVNNQTITLDVSGFGVYMASIDAGAFTPSLVFTNVPLGTHTIQIMDAMGCGSISVSVDALMPNPPTGQTLQTFAPGQTLADLVVSGENILWYANPSATGRMMDVALPLSTVLVDGTTYYASQTINSVESEDRLPVTVTLSLGVAQTAFEDFSFSPNPVKNVLHFGNSRNIEQVKVYNMLGQLVASQNNNSVSQIDLSKVESGIYLVKLNTISAEKTIRIIKD